MAARSAAAAAAAAADPSEGSLVARGHANPRGQEDARLRHAHPNQLAMVGGACGVVRSALPSGARIAKLCPLREGGIGPTILLVGRKLPYIVLLLPY